MEKFIKGSYKFDGYIYTVSATPSFHNKLENDQDFAKKYLTNLQIGISGNIKQEESKDYKIKPDKTSDTVKDESTEFVNSEHESEVVEDNVDYTYEASHENDSSTEKNKLWNGEWSNDAVKVLLDEYCKRKLKFRNPNVKKKYLWQEIANELSKINMHISREGADKKFRNLKNRYQYLKKTNKKSTKRFPWQWMGQMDEIFHDDEYFHYQISQDNIANETLDTNDKWKNIFRKRMRNSSNSSEDNSDDLDDDSACLMLVGEFDDEDSKRKSKSKIPKKSNNTLIWREGIKELTDAINNHTQALVNLANVITNILPNTN